jgi:NitT/TauT family transport system permease protein
MTPTGKLTTLPAGPPSPAKTVPGAGAAARELDPGVRARPTRRARARRLRGLVGVAAAFAVWGLLTALGALSPQDLPSIGAVASSFGHSWHDLLSSAGTTLESLLIGLAVASVAGATLGIAVGLSTWADAFTDVIVRMARPLPSLALIPIAILVAGLSTTMTAGLVAFAAFWPVFINSRYAARQVEPRLLDAGRALGLGRAGLIARVIVPSAAPAVATGIRISAGVATVVTVSVELVAGTGGLGGYVLSAEQGGATADIYAGIIVGGILGWLINRVFAVATRRAFAWESTTRGAG